MRNCYVPIAVWCLVLLTALSVFVGVAHAQQTADDLWDAYDYADDHADAAAINYNTAVDAANDINKQLSGNKKTMDAATKSTLQNVFVTGGLYALGAPTLFIPALGQVKPTLDMVNGWFERGELEKLKAFAEQAASDAHRVAVNKETERNQAYTAYTTQFKIENPGSEPKLPLGDVNHKVYNFACHGGCGDSWDNVEAARGTHRATCALPTASPKGCGKTYYSCTDTSHTVVKCTNFIGYTCGVSFRACSNSQCPPSGSLWTLKFNHSASGIRAGTSGGGKNICPKCGKSHSG